ncbi:MAG: 30S ribosomal protein S1 [Prevotellaceae bacterium]|jgi:small subunit ribosomal protein S1|nr:30S ribosomal protein S1 [Prevotellaceae bacterium]
MEEFNSTNEQQVENTEVAETVQPIEAQQVEVEKPAENFDWDTYEKGDVVTSSEKEKMTQLYDDTLNQVRDKDVVMGKVISINKREVVINIGFKSDGAVPTAEFRYNPDLKIGDEVEVFIENQEDKRGQLVLSHKLARTARAWEKVEAALASQEIIHGYVKCRTRGGMIVEVFGIEAFLPGSQIDVKPIRDYDIFVGKTMEFKVVKINNEFKNIVVSHKALIEAELEAQRKEIISHLEKGQVLEGIVKNITTYGVFIDLGGVDGLIHITDLSWGRVSHPEEVVKLDDKINVVILDFDDEKKRIALGLKQLTPHPWEALDANLKIGDRVKGTVVVMTDYGAFVEVIPGVEGLIHVSEMTWSQHLRTANDFLKVGDTVEAVVLTLDRDERKMSLGIKQLKADPWENIDTKYAVGTKHTARVRNFTNFGVFVEIEEGVDGLIHISDLSWTKKIKHPSEFTQIGSEIEVVVLEIDKENRRLSLGHKQLEENPWDIFETIFLPESIHEGTITELFDKGAVIALPYGVEGFATPKHLIKADGKQAKIDEKLQFKVIEFNKEQKRIILSHSKTFEEEKAVAETKTEEQPAEKKEEVVVNKVTSATTSLGDIEALSDLKGQMLETAKEKLIEKEAKKAKKPAKKAVEEVAEPAKKEVEEVAEPAKVAEKPKRATKKTAEKVEKAEKAVEGAEPAAPKAKKTAKKAKEEKTEK